MNRLPITRHRATGAAHRGTNSLSRSVIAVAAFRCCLLIASTLVWQVSPGWADGGDRLIAEGGRIYADQCQSCHGENGVGGTDGYSEPLVGDASLEELISIIDDTMPEGEPDACAGKDARAVASYIHETFYSKAAQLRNRPPQTQLSRLTASQLQQSLADLYQHFTGPPQRSGEHGIRGMYFNANRWKKEELKTERVDSVLDFDFGREPPVEGITPEEFYIHWAGSLQPPHTGRYEIVVRSSCSFKLRFEDRDKLLINNHVQSEGKTEFRRTINLIGGRQYPMLIDFTQRKRKTEQPPATFSLRWIPPGGTETVIPPEYLLPATRPSTFALQTKLPPDDRSYGYDRGTRVDRQWEDAVTAAALEFGQVAADQLWPQYRRKHRKEPDENREKLRSFLTELAGVAFRGPLDEATKKIYVEDQLAAAEDDRLAIARTCLLVIKSPRFLYPTLDEAQPLDHRIATRLALTFFDSLPSDQWLIDEARKQRFSENRDQLEQRVRQAATRMAEDPRVGGKAMEMFFEWLEINPSQEIVKDQERYPGFDAALVLDLRRSLEKTIDHVFWSDSSDYRQLFRQDWNWTNDRLAEFYGAGWQCREPSKGLALVPGQPAPGVTFGVLTHPLVMSHLSYYDTTSPIHRGVFLIRRVLGRTLRPPNEAFTPINPELHPDLTTRERVELQTGEVKCQVCHSKINPLGFTLEHYDTVGRFRDIEQGKPIDASGRYMTASGTTVPFAGPADLATFLAESEDAQQAFVERVFEHFVKQPIAAFGDHVADDLLKTFRESEFNMRRLIVEVGVVVATHELTSGDSSS